ncbi:MAG: hypothetical protein V3S69_07935 [Dehalococcoidales bacterium]
MNDYSKYTDSIREQALALPDGASMRGKCPQCGSDGTSFCITRNGAELNFIDFSASCNLHGKVLSTGDAKLIGEAKALPLKPLFSGRLSHLETAEISWLSDKFHIPCEHFRTSRYSEDDYRVYYPLYNHLGVLTGYIARAYTELAYGKQFFGQKALNRTMVHGVQGLRFPCIDSLKAAHANKSVAVLEDWPSTMRIWTQTGMPTACLAGTNLLDEHVATMIEMGIEKLVIILDADAIVKAMKMKKANALVFSSTIVIPLTDADPKDMTLRELSDALGDNSW